jgi:hypothetical protein
VIAEDTEAGRLMPTGTWIGHVLIDGFRVGSWKVEDATLTVRNVAPAADVKAEGAALLGLIAPDSARRDVVFA